MPRRENQPELMSFIDIHGKSIEDILFDSDNVRITGVDEVSDETYISVDQSKEFFLILLHHKIIQLIWLIQMRNIHMMLLTKILMNGS